MLAKLTHALKSQQWLRRTAWMISSTEYGMVLEARAAQPPNTLSWHMTCQADLGLPDLKV